MKGLAKGRIQGITIELNGETKGLDNALKGVNQQSTKLTTELRDVEKLLKFNPGNTEALAQKQQLLTKQIENTTQKLDQLRQAESQVEAQFKSGEIGEEQYRAFKREIEYTEGALNGYKGQLAKVESEQENLAQNTKRINTLFEATGSSVDDYADILGGRLTAAIKNGTATSDQLELAINKIGRAALGTDTDIGKMKNALDSVDDGTGIQQVEAELRGLSTQSGNTADALDEMGGKLDMGNLMEASEQVAEVGDKLLEVGKSALESATSIDSAASRYNNSFGLTGNEAKKTKDKIVELYNSGLVDSYEEASEMMIQTRNQLRGLNGESLDNVTKKAVAFSKTFDSDMNESLRGANALMTTYGMSADDAFDLMTVGAQNGLNKTDELGDNLAEYATLFEENGYSAQDMFTILQAGLEGGAYNLDKVNDLVKEFGIRIADGSVEKAVSEMGGSFEKTFQKMKKSGASNKDIFQALVGEVSKLKTEQEKATAISAIFGSMGEDAGIKVIEAMGGASKAVKGIKGNYDDAKGAAEGLTKASDSQKLTKAWHELQSALVPIGTDILNALQPVIDIIKKLADGFKKLPEPVRQFIEIFGGIATLAAVLAPVIAAIAALGSTFGVILIVIAAVAAAIVGIIAIIKNWGSIVEWLKGVWASIVEFFSNLWTNVLGAFSSGWQAIKQWYTDLVVTWAQWILDKWSSVADFLGNCWSVVKEAWSAFWSPIAEWFSGVFEGIKAITQVCWGAIVAVVTTAWDGLMAFLSPIISLLVSIVQAGWVMLQAVTQVAWLAIKKYIIEPVKSAWSWVKSKFSDLSSWLAKRWEVIKAAANLAWALFKKYILEPVKSAWSFVKQKFTDLVSWLSSKWAAVKSTTLTAWNLVKKYIIDPIVNAYNNVKQKVANMWSTVREKFEAIKSTAREKFNAVKKLITDPIEKAKATIKKIIDTIKGFFNKLKLKIPKPQMPKLPHFSLKTSSKKIMGKKIDFPTGFDVKWFAKGGILTKPTAFGMNGGKVLAGGEAGKEAVLPLNEKNLGMIGKMIAETMETGGDSYDFTFNINGNIDKQMIALLKKEVQKVLVEQTRRKGSNLGEVTL